MSTPGATPSTAANAQSEPQRLVDPEIVDNQLSVVVVPIKSFVDAKTRLASILSQSERERLAHQLATGVLQALSEFPTLIVCDDPDIAALARPLGAACLFTDEPGLNHAVTLARDTLAHHGVESIVIVHSDLVDPSDLARVVSELTDSSKSTMSGRAAIIPDRHQSGTNVLMVPTSIDFRFH